MIPKYEKPNLLSRKLMLSDFVSDYQAVGADIHFAGSQGFG